MQESGHEEMTDTQTSAAAPRRSAFVEDLLNQLPRRRKQAIALLADCIALPLALWSALALRLGEWTPEASQFWPAFVVSA